MVCIGHWNLTKLKFWNFIGLIKGNTKRKNDQYEAKHRTQFGLVLIKIIKANFFFDFVETFRWNVETKLSLSSQSDSKADILTGLQN